VATAGTVVFFAIGVPMWGIQQILARGFYAREQMWAPVVVGTLATAAAVPIYWLLDDAMGVDGLALASSVAITLYTAALALVWYRRTGAAAARPRATCLRILLSRPRVPGGLRLSSGSATGWPQDAGRCMIVASPEPSPCS
jgi:peptidoglycan biosynthesis protein MviN/MurJ (putative lipid II flippase)